MRKIVILGDYERSLAEQVQNGLKPSEFQVQAYSDATHDEEILYNRLKNAHIAVVIRERTPLKKDLLSKLPHLELIVSTGTNTSVVDLSSNVPVLGTRSLVNGPAELTWGLILGLARNLPEETHRLNTGAWQESVGLGLDGKTLGLVGLGRVGSKVARVGQAFGMHVTAWSPNLTPERAHSAGATFASLESLFSDADVLSLHLRLSAASKGLVSQQLLQSMKSHALLVNTARAGLIEEEAIVDVMKRRLIGGFAQDVYNEEPLPAGSPLRNLPNTILTPHIGYVTDDNMATFATDVAEGIQQFYMGNPLRRITK